MSKLSKTVLATAVGVLGLGVVHAVVNLGWRPLEGEVGAAEARARYRVGFLPVT